MTDDKTYPPDNIDWVDDEVKEIIDNWILWNDLHEAYGEMVATEGTMISNEDSDDPEWPETEENYQDISVMYDEGLYTIGDDYVFSTKKEADAFAHLIWEGFIQSIEEFDDLATEQPLVKVVLFKHGGNDWGSACYVQWLNGSINNLGYGVVIRRDLLERLKVPYHKASSVSGHTNGGS